jgi:hypothetical protein
VRRRGPADGDEQGDGADVAPARKLRSIRPHPCAAYEKPFGEARAISIAFQPS